VTVIEKPIEAGDPARSRVPRVDQVEGEVAPDDTNFRDCLWCFHLK
jgi:hypothetical protein